MTVLVRVFLAVVLASAIAGCRSGGQPPAPPQAPPNLSELEEDVRQGRASPEENLLLAKARIDGGRHQDALDLLDRLKPANGLIENRRQILRGLSLEGLNRSAGAWAAYEAALAAVPDDPAALLREAAFAFTSGDSERALRFATLSLSRQPGNPEGYYLLYVLEPDPAARHRALVNLIGTDGP